MTQPNDMPPEYQAAYARVRTMGCRACPAHDTVPSMVADGMVDIYCELLQTPGKFTEPVVSGVPAEFNSTLPINCPYFRRESNC